MHLRPSLTLTLTLSLAVLDAVDVTGDVTVTDPVPLAVPLTLPLSLPDNVEVHAGIPLARAMNVLAHSRFTVLPLRGGRVPCGHSTIVPAMHLGKAAVATDSAGVSEYVFHHHNGCLVPPGDVAAMRRTIDDLYGAPEVAAAMGEQGGRFASEHCSEQVAVNWLRRYLGA